MRYRNADSNIALVRCFPVTAGTARTVAVLWTKGITESVILSYHIDDQHLFREKQSPDIHF